jgi:GxxExxY protein
MIMLMNTALQRANAWSQLVIGAAIEVHRLKGAGLLEEIYSKCLGRECELRDIPLSGKFECLWNIKALFSINRYASIF